jgi:hypothetical protein
MLHVMMNDMLDIDNNHNQDLYRVEHMYNSVHEYLDYMWNIDHHDYYLILMYVHVWTYVNRLMIDDSLPHGSSSMLMLMPPPMRLLSQL